MRASISDPKIIGIRSLGIERVVFVVVNYNSTNLHRKGSVTWLRLLDKRSLIRSTQLVYFYFYPEF